MSGPSSKEMAGELAQAAEIAAGVRRHWKAIRKAESRNRRLQVDGFPFDAWLLALSPIYRRSRKLYLDGGGVFRASVISSPRSLSSASLLENSIEYTPIAEELYWSATDRVERASPRASHARILQLRESCAPIFHEQSHRILWQFLPPPPRNQRGIHRYLNFCEALVVATDMALGDFLGPKLSRLFYLASSTYDPGTSVWGELGNRRAYRNYLHAALQATYLNLELHEAEDVRKVVGHLHPLGKDLADRAVDRALRLDRAFVEITNVTWQEKNWRLLRARARDGGLELAADPVDSRLIYLWAERWFEHMGI